MVASAGRAASALRNVSHSSHDRVTERGKKPSYQVQWKDIAGVAVREAVKSGLLELLGNQLESAVPGTPPPEEAAPLTPPGSPVVKDPVRAIGDALNGLLGQ